MHGGGADAPGATERAVRSAPARTRVIDGALSCIAAQGVAKTTLDDVARHAGCSRATVYRAFPGGKDALLRAVVDTEVSRFFSDLAVRMGEADNLEDVLVAGMTEAASRVSGHRALSYLLDREAELVLPHLAFTHLDEVLSVTCAFTAPFLGRWLDTAEARRVAEWAARIVVSYLSCPADGVDLTDAVDARRLVRQFVLPGIRALRTASAVETETGTSKNRSPKTHSQQTNSPNHDRFTPATKGEAS